jgi:serine/threonine protein kinase
MAKSRIYGNRWKIADAPRLGSGGQSEVFRVVDLRAEHEGEFALKRVYNAKRHARFRREIEAVKGFSHPNIIKLVDHSALDDLEENAEQQFLVMPIAKGGHLGQSERLNLYRNSIEGVVTVSKQLASALQVAHAKDIIHRDVKPENVLFTGIGYEVWLADFGICLIREEPRITQSPEVVGPRAFMAPELESGGPLEASSAADIYSLGKLIYFMVTGGTILPRERLHEAHYSQVFTKGERYHFLELLLGRMICRIDQRIKSANEIISELEKIENWEKNARLLPISAEGLSAIERLQRRSLAAALANAENEEARSQAASALITVKQSLLDWIKSQLELVAAQIRTSTVKCEVREAALSIRLVPTGPNSGYNPLAGFELCVEDMASTSSRERSLQIFLAEHHSIVTSTVQVHGSHKPTPSVLPARDASLGLIPIYWEDVPQKRQAQPLRIGYLSKRTTIGTLINNADFPGLNRGRGIGRAIVDPVTTKFDSALSQHISFNASEWPRNEGAIHEALSEAISAFIEFVNSEA